MKSAHKWLWYGKNAYKCTQPNKDVENFFERSGNCTETKKSTNSKFGNVFYSYLNFNYVSWRCSNQSGCEVIYDGVSHGSILKVARMDLKNRKWACSLGFWFFWRTKIVYLLLFNEIDFIHNATAWPWMILEVIKVKKVKF